MTMKLLKNRGKILKHGQRVLNNRQFLGGSINHLLNTNATGGNISELKKQLRNLVIKPKKTKKITF
jgi:hypothetical protein